MSADSKSETAKVIEKAPEAEKQQLEQLAKDRVGIDVDLRQFNVEQLEQILLKLDCKQSEIDKWSRFQRIVKIKTLTMTKNVNANQNNE
jgi:hypothetical protein